MQLTHLRVCSVGIHAHAQVKFLSAHAFVKVFSTHAQTVLLSEPPGIRLQCDVANKVFLEVCRFSSG